MIKSKCKDLLALQRSENQMIEFIYENPHRPLDKCGG